MRILVKILIPLQAMFLLVQCEKSEPEPNENWVAGCKLKEAGTAHWKSPNAGATNSSGFTALPGGHAPGGFGGIGFAGYETRMWMAESGNIFILHKDSASIYFMSCMAQFGMTIRCIKE